MKPKFFYKGKYFKTEKSFLNAVKKWHEKTADEDEWDLFFSDLQKNIIINRDLYEIKISGQEMNELFETMFESALKYLMKKRESFDSLTK